MEVIFFVLQRFVMYYWSVACLFMFYHKWSVLFLDEIEMRHHDTTFIDWTDLLCSQERCSWKESPGSSNLLGFRRDIVYEGVVGWFRGSSSAAKNSCFIFFFGFGFPSGTDIQRGQVETLRGDGKTKRPETYGWQVGVEKTTGGVASLRGSDGFGVVLKR